MLANSGKMRTIIVIAIGLLLAVVLTWKFL